MAEWNASDANSLITEFANVAGKVFDANTQQFVRTTAMVVKSVSGSNITVYPLSGSDDESQYITLKNTLNFYIRAGDIVWVDYWGDYTNAYLSPANRQMYNQASIFPVGSVFITSTNATPAPNLGGTWTLVDKEFEPTTNLNVSIGTTTPYLDLTTNASNASMWCKRTGHTIAFEFGVTTAVDIEDTTTTLANVNMARVGIAEISGVRTFDWTWRGAGWSDGAAAITLMSVTSAGAINITDNVRRNTNATLPSGNTIYFSYSVPLNYQRMDDSVCNKFYWKRTQ